MRSRTRVEQHTMILAHQRVETVVPEQPLPLRTAEVFGGAECNLRQGPRRQIFGAAMSAEIAPDPAHVTAVPEELQRPWVVLEELPFDIPEQRFVQDVQIPQRGELGDLQPRIAACELSFACCR